MHSVAGFARTGAFVFLLGLFVQDPSLHAATFNVNSTADMLNPPAGTVTLRSAIQAANASFSDNTINLAVAGTYRITLAGVDPGDNSSGAFDLLPAGGNLTIVNTSGGTVIVDGSQIDRVFNINPGSSTASTVTMDGFTITNGSAQNSASPDGPGASGGGIRAEGNVSLTLTNMIVTNNQASADGGGISMVNPTSASWTLTLNNTLVSANLSGDSGGGIESDGSGNIFLNSGTIVSTNSALNYGGGICLDSIQAGSVFQSANLTLQNAVVKGNRVLASTGAGGGIANTGNGTVTISNSTIEHNNSAGTGGGYGDINAAGKLSVTGSEFLNNVAAGNGGAIASCAVNVAITQSEIDGNSSSALGGGLYTCGNGATISQSTFANNGAAQGGGGMELQGLNATQIVNSTLTENAIVNNAATGAGGGIDFNPVGTSGALTLENDTISANTASTTQGGGIFWGGASGSVTLQNTIVAGNTAPSGPDADNPAGTFTDGGGNLIGVSGTGSGNTGFTVASQTGNVGNPLNPMLGPLGNNGGLTLTLPLLSGSPAIDKGVTNALTTDERGVPRPQGPAYDAGAYEFNVGPTPTAQLSALNIDFGDLAVGASSSQTITLTNVGTGGLALSALTPSGADAGDFAITPANGCTAPATLAASQACEYSVTFTPKVVGPRTAKLTFTDNTLNAPGSTQAVAIAGTGITLTSTSTSLALSSGTSPSTVDTSITFTATVTPATATGLVNFFDGGTSIGAIALSNGTAALTTTSLSVGTHSITAQYVGDTSDSGSTSPAVQQVVTAAAPPADFTISANPSTATVAAGASATFTFTVTPQNGFTQPITFICAGLPSGAQCNFAPASITPSGAAVASTLTITTTATSTSTSMLRMSGIANGVLVFAGLFWIGIRRRRRHFALLALGVVMLGMTTGLTSCGGNTTTVTKTLTPGTPAGTSQVTVLATGGGSNHTATVTLTVQ